jgi:Protein of unknown function (DUF1553)/Protein of unknown function (DUF1549)/Planctomycete cytochrome C
MKESPPAERARLPNASQGACTMNRSMRGIRTTSALALFVVAAGPAWAQNKVDFNRDIRPILSDKCFACHGPDTTKLKGKLRLDVRDVAIKKGAFVPGKPDESELVRRVHAADPNEIMPPPKSNKTLTAAEKDLLKRWIAAGADYKIHWAYLAPVRPPAPPVKHASWPQNPIDDFVLARLEQEGLSPASEAARTALIRRVTLDLTGLPPTIAEVDAFLKDTAPNAYERLVDRLLESPRYGEHMTRYWLDAARYGDTHGMHLDNYREMFPYRDWVINAFNRNLPFDRFLVEQIAGDLLPGATLEQKVATGFLRCHVTTNEGGSIEEEVYVRNVQDRVDTNGIVLLGMTFGCAKCHDHKYDPVSQKDYYAMFAFFNNLDGSAMDGNTPQHPPVIRMTTREQSAKLQQIDKRMDAIKAEIKETALKVKYDTSRDEKLPEEPVKGDYVWIDDGPPAGARELPPAGINVAWSYVGKPAPVLSGAKSVRLHTTGLNQVVFENAKPGLTVGAGDTFFAYVWIDPANPPRQIMLQWFSSTWLHRAYWGENLIGFGADNTTERVKMGPLPAKGEWVRLEVDAAKVGVKPGTVITGWAFTQHDGTCFWDKGGLTTRLPQGERHYDTLSAWIGAQKALNGTGLPKPAQDAVKAPREKRNQTQKTLLLEYFLEHAYSGSRSAIAPLQQESVKLAKEKDAIEKSTPTTLVFKERNDLRPAYLLKRGEYDRKGDKVERATPSFLPPLPDGASKNRLGFAQWLTDPRHPLTARVAVNRFWQQFFGTGLVKTAEDFGSQGEPPSHPELLDWLAVQFMDDGWDVKKTVRRIVTSAAYRQSSRVAQDRLAKDPQNRFVSRGPRYRLDAEILRDQALFVGGLLVERVGGPSVKPPQPPGLWEAVAFTGSNTGIFKADTGHEKVHRRSMYIFWKRTAHAPQMGTLDAPSREACLVRRERTNTPLQALLMMNEMLFVEASRGLAERALRDIPADTDARLRYVFRTATARMPDEVEMAILRDAMQEHLTRYRANPKAAQQLIRVGETPPSPAYNGEELAAWTMIGNLVLNLDEVINR